MRDLGTIIGSKADTSIQVNGLLVPANSLGEHLRAFAEPALMHSSGFGRYHLSKSGTLTKVKARGRYFALISHHQLRKGSYEYEQVCLLGTEQQSLLTSHRVVFQVDEEKESSDFDCVIFEFTDVVRSGKLSSLGWYDLSLELFDEKLPKPIVTCAIGYFGHRNLIDYKTFNYPISPHAIWGEETEPKMKERLAFKPINPIGYNPTGMSGSPVFGVSDSNNLLQLFFAGLLTNASASCFHFTPRIRISLALEHALKD